MLFRGAESYMATSTITPTGGDGAVRATAAVMIRRAAELVPVLAARAEKCEQSRSIPGETLENFISAGIVRVSQPVTYGGLGLDMDTALELAMELGRGCGSSAWLGSFWPLHNWMVGMWPQQAQDEYWTDSHDAVSSTAWNMLSSKIDSTSGGLRLSGHWDFSSGIDHASWAMLFIPGPRMALLPKKDFRIVDNWHVTGLCGTGSKEVYVEDSFVPDHRILQMEDAATGNSAGRELYGTSFYKMPIYTWLTYTLVAPAIGMAQGALESFEELMRVRVEGISGGRAGERQSNHLRLAESSAEIDAARLTLRHNIKLLIDSANSGDELSTGERLRIRRDIVFAGKLCHRATQRLFETGGAHSILRSAPLQRFTRDVDAAFHSGVLNWDPNGEAYGRFRLGLAPNTFFF
jgi:alkylation response protein AidB-like acyl-CoA dehydrogenase